MTEHATGHSACCAPAGTQSALLPLPPAPPALPGKGVRGDRHRVTQAYVPAQTFLMGDARGDENRGDGETPVHPVALERFSIDATTVTNDDFARFVDDSGYRTEAEVVGFSAVFHLVCTASPEDILGQPPGTPWWYGVRNADWRHPGGAGSDLDGLGDHPVVHVSWNDAMAYCAWAGRDLPTEAQWEAASRGGLDGARFPWGEDRGGQSGQAHRMNVWQGTFPTVNTREDGYLATAPVRSYEPNEYGLWQTVGNVWEWCADWWDPRYYASSPVANPRGPDRGPARVVRGGSFLCHDSYCNRYRNAARSSNTPDSSMSNTGFRTVSTSRDSQ
ncbi:formylglycine-generating enzyme family protein [Microbacterium sp. NPDC056044]|uniref:formylglycine-generating enzyme family protein n=1 Tax=Microbacterium sp. NPDC056044 TaxID=3345690 RepID=UPI0035D9183E